MPGRTALITGGTSGIGLAAAQLFCQQGMDVMLMGRSSERGSKALSYLQGEGGQVSYTAGDISCVQDDKRAVAETVEKFGQLDVLVNSAGIYFERALEDMTEELFLKIMDINIKGMYFMCQAALPELKKQRGNIVNVSSDAGLQGNFLCTAYCASKGAVTLFTKSLALETAAAGVRVNCICPGDIMTPLTEAQLAKEPSRDEALREMSAVYPVGRIGKAEEAAAVIAFLASDAAAFVTGAAWSVDGGITA